MARPREIALLTLLPLVLFLLLAEAGLRFYLSRNIFYDVEMSRYARLLKVDAENPRVGHVHRPNGHARLMGVDVRTNSAGFRDDEYALARSHRRRIIFLGDSLTFGWGVEKEESFEHRLEKSLDDVRPTEIINFAAGNYNTTQEVNLFLDRGLAYQPDQVVLFYFINDAEPAPQRSRLPWLGSVRIVTFYWSRLKAVIARFDDSAGYQAYYSALYEQDAEGWRDTRDSLLLLARTCRERGIALQVVLLPELHDLIDYPFAQQYEKVASVLRENGVDVLDLTPAFAGEANPHRLWVALDDAHPNAEAHRRIAEASHAFIGGPGEIEALQRSERPE
jgi:lysophospholipase L1-like esterase